MARASKKANGSKDQSPPLAIHPADRIVDALMALAAEENFEDITLSMIAERAQVSLADFRDLYTSKGAVLAAFARRIDHVVLEGTTSDMAEESARERLFDVLMRRLDALAPYKKGLEGIAEWAQRDPLAAAPLGRLGMRSMRFMLEAAGIDSGGRLGPLKLRGLGLTWMRILAVWMKDDDAGLSATMAELDRALTRGDKILARAKDVDRLISPLRAVVSGVVRGAWRMARDRGRRRRNRDIDANAAANEI
jgi:AcrR family transcriptional regulator